METPGPRFRAVGTSRLIVAALAFLSIVRPVEGQLSQTEIDEAAEFAKRAARAVSNGSPRVFAEALDIDAILQRGVTPDAWAELTSRQRDQLRTAVRYHFLETLEGPRSSGGDIAWSWVEPASNGADVLLGIRFTDRTLKTRWMVRRVGAGWKITDIVLTDPGISLAASSMGSLGPQPVRRRQAVREAEEVAYPRIIGLGALALVLMLLAPRVPPPKRILLYLTLSAPAILFIVDGVLAVNRTLKERYAISEPGTRELWREAEQLALAAERDGRAADASQRWAQALAKGAPPAPIEYQIGLAARRRGDFEHARQEFAKALAEREPAPGAARELASLDVAAGRDADAEQNLRRYIEMAGPDPESLSLQAVLLTNLGKPADSLRSLQQARSLLGDAWRAAELEAQVRARAGDAAGAVAVLRTLDAQGLANRSDLRADPNYLPIATDPVWVAFINEGSTPATPSSTRQK
ncbi:MAG TPA: hypothetical protein VF376_01545 [Thermoanaerobaculia bacterium]